MKKLFYLLLFCIFGIISACSTDEDSKEAKAYELEMALEAKNYDKIISELQNSDVTDIDYTRLSQREKYLLQMAWIGKSGFSALDIIDQFFEDNADTTDILFSSVSAGTASADKAALTAKKDLYSLVSAMDNDVNNRDHFDLDINTASGIASALKSVIIVSDLALGLSEIANISGVSPDNISFDKDAPNYVGNIFDNVTNDDLKDKINEMVDVEELNKTIEDLSSAVDNLASISNEDDTAEVKEKFDDFLNKISNCRSGTCEVTKDSLESYINETFRQK